jgi:tetratricopeptide (TPR) repeat protein
MEFLTPSQRLKKLRKNLNMKQYDFDQEDLTRAYYGMIETGQRNLNIDIAKKIIKKFKAKAAEIGVDFDFDEHYLIMSPKNEAEMYCLNHLKKDLPIEQADELISIAKQYGLEEVEAAINKILGDNNYSTTNYNDAFLNYIMSLDIYKNTSNEVHIPYLYNRLGMCKFKALEFTEANLYFNRAIYYSQEQNNNETLKNSIYNVSQCYRQLNKLDEAIKYIDIYITKWIKDEQTPERTYAKSLKANYLYEKGNIDEAISIYIDLIENAIDTVTPQGAYLCNNLGILYLKIDDLPKSLEYFGKSQEIRMKVDKPSLSHTVINKAEAYIKQQMYDEAIMLVRFGIDMAQEYNDSEYLLKAYYLLADIYTLCEDYKNTEENFIKIVDILKDKKNKLDLLKVYLKLSELNFKTNNNEIGHKYLKMSQNTLELCV